MDDAQTVVSAPEEEPAAQAFARLDGRIARMARAVEHLAAAHIIGESSLWDAGARMMRAENPDAWRGILGAAKLWRDNRDAVVACEKSAARTEQPVRCAIRITHR